MANSVTRSVLLAEIARRGWTAQEVGPEAHFLKIIHPDGRWEMLRGSCPMRSSAIGHMLCKRKNLTMDFATLYGYRMPSFQLLSTLKEATQFLHQEKRIALKPIDGQQSDGVTINITDETKLKTAFAYATMHSSSGQLIAQTHLTGNLYRLLVLDGNLIAASWRIPASVIGDNLHTIRELITIANTDPLRSPNHDTALQPIDYVFAQALLGETGLDRVPTAGEVVIVCEIPTVSAGGQSVNMTNDVHKDWRVASERLTTEAGLFICGLDIICEDITKPMDGNYFPLLEMNAAPGTRLHEFPTGGGEPVHIAPLLLDALFDK